MDDGESETRTEWGPFADRRRSLMCNVIPFAANSLGEWRSELCDQKCVLRIERDAATKHVLNGAWEKFRVVSLWTLKLDWKWGWLLQIVADHSMTDRLTFKVLSQRYFFPKKRDLFIIQYYYLYYSSKSDCVTSLQMPLGWQGRGPTVIRKALGRIIPNKLRSDKTFIRISNGKASFNRSSSGEFRCLLFAYANSWVLFDISVNKPADSVCEVLEGNPDDYSYLCFYSVGNYSICQACINMLMRSISHFSHLPLNTPPPLPPFNFLIKYAARWAFEILRTLRLHTVCRRRDDDLFK